MKGGELAMADEQKEVKTISASILKRGFSPEEFDRIIGVYRSIPRRSLGGDRTQNLSKPLTEQEHKILHDYLNTRDTIRTLTERYELEGKNVTNLIKTIGIRYLYQNRETLK